MKVHLPLHAAVYPHKDHLQQYIIWATSLQTLSKYPWNLLVYLAVVKQRVLTELDLSLQNITIYWLKMENSNKINTYNKKTASQQVVGEVGRKMNNRTHLYDCMIEYIKLLSIIWRLKKRLLFPWLLSQYIHTKTLQTNYFVHLKALHLVSSCALITSIQMEQPELLIHAYSLPKVIKWE